MPSPTDATDRSFCRPPLGRRIPVLVVPLFSMALMLAIPTAVGAIDHHAYFTVTPDPRLCPSPVCGGFWVQAVNQPSTTCADGSQQASCYVASADFGALGSAPGFGSGEVVVRGRIDSEEYPSFGDLGRLVVGSAWTGVTTRSSEGTYYRVRDLGIFCFASPCFSLEARTLNQAPTLALSKLDLTAVSASPEQLAAAWESARRAELIVVGRTESYPDTLGEGLALIASQFHLPEPGHPPCLSDTDCPTGTRCNAAELCFPPPGCEPGDPCPSVCSGYCEPATACTTNTDCEDTQYCAVDGLCRSDGSCRLEVDCNLPGHDYPHIECVGHGICESGGTGVGPGACGWQCTNPMCLDLLGYDFGPCDAVLGWGVTEGVCVEVSGCEADPFTLFTSSEECTTGCRAAPAVPALGSPATFGLALLVSALALAWLGRRRDTVVAQRRIR